jgi:hypothetical protein
MASLPPLDWEHAAGYVALFLGCGAFFALEQWSNRHGYRRKAAIVHAKLASQRCRRCGGALDYWDGQFLRGDAHFNPGGYVPMVRLSCTNCHAEQVFYVFSECCRTARGSLALDCRLCNRDILFAGLPSDGQSV